MVISPEVLATLQAAFAERARSEQALSAADKALRQALLALIEDTVSWTTWAWTSADGDILRLNEADTAALLASGPDVRSAWFTIEDAEGEDTTLDDEMVVLELAIPGDGEKRSPCFQLTAYSNPAALQQFAEARGLRTTPYLANAEEVALAEKEAQRLSNALERARAKLAQLRMSIPDQGESNAPEAQ